MWRGDSRNGVYCSCSTPFVEKDVIFGVCQKGELRAVDLRTGQRLWETNSPTTGPQRQTYGTAFLVKHDDRYFLFNETGDLVLARLSRERYQEISRFHVLEPTNEAFGRPVVWSHPAFANQCVYARNDKEIVCVSLAE
jgi:outer membrane protein assembly factor BamB